MLQSLERQRMIWWMWFHFWDEMRDWSESERQHEEGKWANRFRQKYTPPPRQPPLLGEITVPMATQLIAWKLLWLWVPWQHIIFRYIGVKSLPALRLCVFCTWQWDGTPHSVMSFFLLHLVFTFCFYCVFNPWTKEQHKNPRALNWVLTCTDTQTEAIIVDVRHHGIRTATSWNLLSPHPQWPDFYWSLFKLSWAKPI